MKSKFLLILVIILLLLFSFSILFLPRFLLCDTIELDAYLVVGDHLGFNVDTTAIYFGTAPPGASPSRSVYINNTGCRKSRVVVEVEGDFSEWVDISDNNFILLMGEGKDVDFVVTIPSDAGLGNYSSKVKFYFWKII